MTVDPRANTVRRRIPYIDVANVVAMACVVVLHCNGCFWEGPAQGSSWFSANLIETLLYWPVPVFFMISGATLMDYRDRMTTRQYFRKRAMRILVPFAVWSFIGVAYQCFWSIRATGTFDFSPVSVVNGIFGSSYVPVYWFFFPLIAVYLSIPILSAITQRKKVFLYIAGAGTLFVFVLPFVFQLAGLNWNADITPPPVMGFVTYAVAGWLIVNIEIGKKLRLAIYALAIVGFLMQLIGTYALSTPDGGVDQTFKHYLNLPAFLQSIGVFLLFRNIGFEGSGARGKIAKACSRLAPLSFGIYLMHWFFIDVITRSGIVDPHSLAWRLGGALLIFALCALISFAAKRIPLIRHIIP